MAFTTPLLGRCPASMRSAKSASQQRTQRPSQRTQRCLSKLRWMTVESLAGASWILRGVSMSGKLGSRSWSCMWCRRASIMTSSVLLRSRTKGCGSASCSPTSDANAAYARLAPSSAEASCAGRSADLRSRSVRSPPYLNATLRRLRQPPAPADRMASLSSCSCSCRRTACLSPAASVQSTARSTSSPKRSSKAARSLLCVSM
mmetsp:Transcript_28588/g.89090  ORF Transcript_28588/g.89090 Transcript_28588/m.89090 type:complete len:203 (-) Transcript_28588:761-1369(-)